ncbi:MAG: hypothetical protein FWC03_02380 [Treponema sp.]|nr:hypothetical protein [Treponema sp.]
MKKNELWKGMLIFLMIVVYYLQGGKGPVNGLSGSIVLTRQCYSHARRYRHGISAMNQRPRSAG